MTTSYKIFFHASQQMTELADNSVDLVVTSPPYPMIEMWDEVLGQQNPEITKALGENNPKLAFEFMHSELDQGVGGVLESNEGRGFSLYQYWRCNPHSGW